MASMYGDVMNYFNTATPGSSKDWAGGTLTMGDSGLASYLDPTGSTYQFSATTPLSDVYNANPYIADPWTKTYPDLNLSSNLGTSASDIPTDKYSTSGSQSSSTSKSGIDWNNPLVKALSPVIQQTRLALPGLANNLGETLQGSNRTAMNQALSPEAFTGTMNSLANRGALSSSVASDTLGKAGSDIAQDIANKQWESTLAQIEKQMSIPGLLGELAKLGTYSKSAYSGTSTSEHPLEPYALMAGLLTS